MSKVLIVCPHLDNSMRLLADMLRYLDPRFEVTLFVLEDSLAVADEFPPHIPRTVLDHGMRKQKIAGTFWKLYRAARRADLVVVWAELSPTYLAVAASMLARRPCIGWVHAHLSRIFDLGQRPAWLHRPFIRLFYRRLAACVGVSKGVAADLRERHGLERSLAIVNGIDLERVRRLSDEPIPEHLREVFGDAPVLVSAAALHYQKNPQLLLAAHKRLRDEGLFHRLIYMGTGPLRDEMEQAVKEKGLTDSVTFAGYVLNPYPVIRAADAFVLGSRWEGYALVVAESLAVGTPVISTDCMSGPGEILHNGRYGLLTPVDDVDAMTDAMRTMLTDPAQREMFKRRAPEGAEQTSIIPRTRQMEALFDQVLEGRPFQRPDA